MAENTTLALKVNVFLGNEDNKTYSPLGTYWFTIPKANPESFPFNASDTTRIVSSGDALDTYNQFISWMNDGSNLFGVGYYYDYVVPNANAQSYFVNMEGFESPYVGVSPRPRLSLLFQNVDTRRVYASQTWQSPDTLYATIDDWVSNTPLAQENGGFCQLTEGSSGRNRGYCPCFYYDELDAETNLPTILYTVQINGLGSTGDDLYCGYLATSNATWYENVFIRWVGQSIRPYDPDLDPYEPDSEHAGGDGENQPTDEIGDETLPTIQAIDTGFVTLYKPSISQLNSLASYMWNTLDISLFKAVFANAMDVILGLSILPGIVPSGGSSTVMVGNISTGVSMTKVGNQYVKFSCGSVTIKRKWGAFLDYSPYTRAFIYLPFIGTHPIDVDEIMNKTVSVVYNIDVLSGGCCAFVKSGGTTLYTYIGQCAASVPVTGKDWSTMINGVLGAVSSVAGTIGSVASGNLLGAVSGVASIAQNVTSAKPTYQRSGSMGGMGGMMGIKTPYIIIERPVQAVPGWQNRLIGYPSFITRYISELTGYTEIEQCHLDNIPCTSDELEEIENILKTGVIL